MPPMPFDDVAAMAIVTRVRTVIETELRSVSQDELVRSQYLYAVISMLASQYGAILETKRRKDWLNVIRIAAKQLRESASDKRDYVA